MKPSSKNYSYFYLVVSLPLFLIALRPSVIGITAHSEPYQVFIFLFLTPIALLFIWLGMRTLRRSEQAQSPTQQSRNINIIFGVLIALAPIVLYVLLAHEIGITGVVVISIPCVIAAVYALTAR
jgi:predicted ABC-type exoprotein transport system permease subunit